MREKLNILLTLPKNILLTFVLTNQTKPNNTMQTIKRIMNNDNTMEAILALGIVIIGLFLTTIFLTFP